MRNLLPVVPLIGTPLLQLYSVLPAPFLTRFPHSQPLLKQILRLLSIYVSDVHLGEDLLHLLCSINAICWIGIDIDTCLQQVDVLSEYCVNLREWIEETETIRRLTELAQRLLTQLRSLFDIDEVYFAIVLLLVRFLRTI